MLFLSGVNNRIQTVSESVEDILLDFEYTIQTFKESCLNLVIETMKKQHKAIVSESVEMYQESEESFIQRIIEFFKKMAQKIAEFIKKVVAAIKRKILTLVEKFQGTEEFVLKNMDKLKDWNHDRVYNYSGLNRIGFVTIKDHWSKEEKIQAFVKHYRGSLVDAKSVIKGITVRCKEWAARTEEIAKKLNEVESEYNQKIRLLEQIARQPEGPEKQHDAKNAYEEGMMLESKVADYTASLRMLNEAVNVHGAVLASAAAHIKGVKSEDKKEEDKKEEDKESEGQVRRMSKEESAKARASSIDINTSNLPIKK